MNTVRDKSNADPRYAVTLPDGRSFILHGTFALALDKKHGLGFLASVIFHETRHFDYLSRACPTSSHNCSWASETEDERDAYAEQNNLAHTFGLTGADKAAFIEQWRRFDAEVKAGRLKSFNPDPADEAKWAKYYPKQLDLETEYETLRAEVANSHIESDRRLAALLRDIAVKDCANPDAAVVGEVENLPRAFDAHLAEGAPGGLTSSCAISLYLFLAQSFDENHRPTKFEIQKMLYAMQHPPTAVPLPSSPALAPAPPPIRLSSPDPNWQARAVYNLSWKACQPGTVVTQDDIDALGPFPTGSAIPGTAGLESRISGCWRSVFDRILAANRPGTDLTPALLAQWAVEAQPRQPIPYHRRDPDDRPDPPPHPKHCIPRDPAHPDIPGSCEEGYHD